MPRRSKRIAKALKKASPPSTNGDDFGEATRKRVKASPPSTFGDDLGEAARKRVKASSPSTFGDDFGAAARKRVDDFFKQLESDDEEDYIPKSAPGNSINRPTPTKDDAFYSLSEFEEDLENPVKNNSPSSSSSPKPSTSTSDLTTKPEETQQNPFEYVVSLLESSDESDEEEKAAKAEAEKLNFQQLKKRTQEIVGEVEDYLKSLHPPIRPVEESEAPACPICLEEYDGGPRQAMATLCGHIFCKECITAIVASTKKCPTCRKRVNIKQVHQIYI